jgi:hypothetical protein
MPKQVPHDQDIISEPCAELVSVLFQNPILKFDIHLTFELPTDLKFGLSLKYLYNKTKRK